MFLMSVINRTVIHICYWEICTCTYMYLYDEVRNQRPLERTWPGESWWKLTLAIAMRTEKKEQMLEVFRQLSNGTGDYSFENAHWTMSITSSLLKPIRIKRRESKQGPCPQGKLPDSQASSCSSMTLTESRSVFFSSEHSFPSVIFTTTAKITWGILASHSNSKLHERPAFVWHLVNVHLRN